MNDQNEQLGKKTWPTINYSFVLAQLKADIVQFQTEMINILLLQNFCMQVTAKFTIYRIYSKF